MDANNVKIHMQTSKQPYEGFKKLMNLSVIGWNDSEKTLVLEDETFHAYVEVYGLYLLFTYSMNSIVIL